MRSKSSIFYYYITLSSEKIHFQGRMNFMPLFLVVSALFSAVEHGQVEKVRTIVENTEVDVNGLNNDHLTPLDVALLTQHSHVAKLLISKGARPNTYCKYIDIFLNLFIKHEVNIIT